MTETRNVSEADREFVVKMWEKKCAHEDHFAHAELLNDVDRPDLSVHIKRGTTVLVTMISRLGDVGIRATSIKDVRHGYSVRVMPYHLHNYRWAAPTPAREGQSAWPDMVNVEPAVRSDGTLNRQPKPNRQARREIGRKNGRR